MNDEQKEAMLKTMEEEKSVSVNVEGKGEFKVSQQHVTFERETRHVVEEKYTPSVIEPSFGIGRIVYCIFEHCFKVRAEEATRTYFFFPPAIAPVKCSLLPLINNAELNSCVRELSKSQIN